MTREDWVKITVDGREIEARKGAMLIEATDAIGVRIPRFCYHKKLSVAANCRMCLVEVEKAPKPLPACATPIVDGMIVRTASAKAIDAQQGTMEFLLINHPLDCPICDQGGECELQDVAMGYGAGVSRFSEGKRAVEDKYVGPLIATGMDRCIHCTRCIRFGDEIAGVRELGATGRGEHMEIGTYIGKAMTSELSGNVIDVCPVGALMSKPAHNIGRSWEYVQHAAIAPHDSVGSNLYLHTLRNKIMRVVPRENEAVNEVWLSDRDRFSYLGVYSDDRVTRPLVRAGDAGPAAAGWDAALAAAHAGLAAVVERYGADALGVLVSPRATLEELYLAQKLARGLGCHNIDHRLRQGDFSDDPASPPFPWLGQSLAELETVDAALLIGSDVRRQQPLACHRLRKAALAGAAVYLLNPYRYDYHFPLADNIVAGPDEMPGALAAIARAAAERDGAEIDTPDNLRALLEQAEVTRPARDIAAALAEGELSTVLLGNLAESHPQGAALRTLAAHIAAASGAALGFLPEAANSAGAWLAGALPQRLPGANDNADRPGLHARALFEQPRRGYLLVGVEPELDCWDGDAALAALQDADFVVSLSPYLNETMRAYADVVLPCALFAETAGTYVNAEGRWQSFAAGCAPLGETRPGWKVLRVLGNLFGLDGFGYLDSTQIRDELQSLCQDLRPDNLALRGHRGELPRAEPAGDGILRRVGDWPIYAADPLVRRAGALQQTPLGEAGAARLRLHPDQARELGLAQAERAEVRYRDRRQTLPLLLDPAVPPGCVWLPHGHQVCAGFGPANGALGIGKA